MQDAKYQILAFATHVGNPMRDPEQKAMDRRWLDPKGQPTREGTALVSALMEQRLTRSTFGSVA